MAIEAEVEALAEELCNADEGEEWWEDSTPATRERFRRGARKILADTGGEWWPESDGPGALRFPLEAMRSPVEAALWRRCHAVLTMHHRDGETGFCVVCGPSEGWPCRTRSVLWGEDWKRS